MKIGILNAIPPEDGTVNWQGGPVQVYIDFLEQAGPQFTYTGYNVTQGQFPGTPGECDAYLITGSPRGAYDEDEWVLRLNAFIREAYRAGVRLVGICFGHQILAQALGGRAEKSTRGWGLGWKSFEIHKDKSWMTGAPDSCGLYFAHQDQVVRLPPGAELLGGSEFCPNALFTMGSQVLGIQGHPEFSEGVMGDIFGALEGVIDQRVFEAAAYSMSGNEPDNQLFAQWIVNFLATG